MYKDNSLIPSEAVRLAALGLLAKAERSYADLARDVRHFTARVAGPSLELLGPSLSLLKIEGLLEALDPTQDQDRQIVRLTPAGRAELLRLMTANLRGPMGEVNKLIVALKMYFLDLLDRQQRIEQLEMLVEVCDRELIRLGDLRDHLADSGGLLMDWLDSEIAEVEVRREWFMHKKALQ
jgi:DNA-binding PadR family transcriptional regulator